FGSLCRSSRKTSAPHACTCRRKHRDANSKAKLHAELYLVGLGKEAADIFTGETSEARVLEPQSKCPCDVVAQAHTVVDAVARPPIDRRQRGYEGCARIGLGITEAAVQREARPERPTRVHVGIPRAG